jgi:hypothetical protein
MGHAKEALEHSEHISHASADHGHGGGLSTRIGITIAVLGVFLAVAGAKVGGERTELVGTMVEQEHAHAEFQMQNIKHRMTVLVLRQVHAAMQTGVSVKDFDADLQKIETEALKRPDTASTIPLIVQTVRSLGHTAMQRAIPSKADALMLARLVDRYYEEQESAKKWVDEFDPAVKAHADAQEQYEWGQLAAEFGVVICSLALLFRSRMAWIVSLGLGLVSMGIVVATFIHTSHVVHQANANIEEARKVYEEKHLAGKTRPLDKAMVEDVLEFYGEKRSDLPAGGRPTEDKARSGMKEGEMAGEK